MEKIKNKNLIKSILVTLSLVLTLSFGLVLFKDNVNVVKADSDYVVELEHRTNKVTSFSTAPIIDSSYFDYKSTNFASKIDYFTSAISDFNNTGSTNSVTYSLISPITSSLSLTNSTYYNMLYSLKSDGSIYSNNLGNRGCYFSHYDTQSDRYVDSVRINTNISGANELIKDFKLSIIVVYNSNTSLYYTFATPRLSNLYTAYVNGLAEADTTSSYNNGYSAGQNNVINNPSNYNLYTQEQYDNNYNAGYSAGVITGQNNVINNPSNYNLYTKQQYDNNYTNGYNAGIAAVTGNPSNYNLYTKSEYDNNYDTGYNNGIVNSDNYNIGYNAGITTGQNNVINNPSNYNLYTQEQYDNNYNAGYNDGYDSAKNDFTGLGIFSYVTYYNYAKGYGNNSDYLISSGRFNSDNVTYYNGGFYNNKTLRTELENYLDNNSSDYNGGYLSLIFDSPISTTRYYNFVTRGFEFGNSIDFYFDDNTTLNYNRADSFNTDAINFQNLNKNIVKINLNFANADYLVVGLSANTLVEDSYNTGYIDGKNSVDTTIYYNNGYNSGYNNGKNDGIEFANNYSFLSLIGSVVDAPIKAFTGLFNFDLLGFNLLNFVKALFTLSVIIIVARFVLAKM